MPGLDALIGTKRLLLVVATSLEATPLCRGLDCSDPADSAGWDATPLTHNTDLTICGVGKANAAAATALALSKGQYGLVLSVGIAGLLPSAASTFSSLAAPPQLGAIVAATESVFADEGIQTPGGFQDLGRMGFPLSPAGGCGFACEPSAVLAFERWGAAQGKIATVSTCSGTDARAADLAGRLGCIAEAMEGAAVAIVATRMRVPFGEIRAISNTTGDRDQQRWQMPVALASLARLGEYLRASAGAG
jgi:futalosine hydrolase